MALYLQLSRWTFSFAFLFVLFEIPNAHEYSEEGWLSASKFLRAFMNPEKNPCWDIYGHTCGNAASFRSQAGFEHFRQEEIDLQNKLFSSLQRVNRQSSRSSMPEYQQRLAAIYQHCMDLTVVSDKQLSDEILNEIIYGSGPSSSNNTSETASPTSQIWHGAGSFEQGFMSHILIEASVDWLSCTKKPILKMRYMYASKPYFTTSNVDLIEDSKSLMGAFMNESFEEMAGSDEATQQLVLALMVAQIFGPVMNLQVSLIELVAAQEERQGSADEAGTIMKLSQLRKKYPGVDWDSYLTGLFNVDWAAGWKESDPEVRRRQTG